MTHIVHTQQLFAEGILDQSQVDVIVSRSRDIMMTLVINVLLSAGVVSAALGLVFWLADALAVAASGATFIVLGVFGILKAGRDFRMIAQAFTLIGVGMLLSGLGFELLDRYDLRAGPALVVVGAVSGALALIGRHSAPDAFRFPASAGVAMAAALHITGLLASLELIEASGFVPPLGMLYIAGVIAGLGYWLDVRTLTAVAIVPFAQALDTGTQYFHAAYVFYSPEPTLTILQMLALIALCLWGARRLPNAAGRPFASQRSWPRSF